MVDKKTKKEVNMMSKIYCKKINEDDNKKIIEKLIQEMQYKYPVSLKVKDIIEFTGYSQATVYRMLECGEIPGAKKIRGWRVPRDVFIAWWYMDSADSDDLL